MASWSWLKTKRWSHLKRSCATWGKENLHVDIFKVSLHVIKLLPVSVTLLNEVLWNTGDFEDCQLHRPRPVTQFSSRSCKMVGESARESNVQMSWLNLLLYCDKILFWSWYVLCQLLYLFSWLWWNLKGNWTLNKTIVICAVSKIFDMMGESPCPPCPCPEVIWGMSERIFLGRSSLGMSRLSADARTCEDRARIPI